MVRVVIRVRVFLYNVNAAKLCLILRYIRLGVRELKLVKSLNFAKRNGLVSVWRGVGVRELKQAVSFNFAKTNWWGRVWRGVGVRESKQAVSFNFAKRNGGEGCGGG